jgi:predicted alpha/beta-fold hydrolase
MQRSAFPPFRARSPWWGPDLQTLRNAVRGAAFGHVAPEEERLLLDLGDGTGDALSASLALPERVRGLPLVVLIHGLSGSEESAYMLSSGRFWHARGHPVLRLNLRGAGPSREHCRQQYHAGRSEDLRAALLGLRSELLADGLLLVGYSLGGNMLLKFLAESGGQLPVRAAASVSAPIDLSAASQRFLAPRNLAYHRHLLRAMKRECFGGRSEMSDEEARVVRGAKSIYQFDDCFVAPRNGFRDAEHYYEENHARRFLADIRVPTLLVQALDDPWIPSLAYREYDWASNRRLTALLCEGGGHVGFHDRHDRVPWYDRCVGQFWDGLA